MFTEHPEHFPTWRSLTRTTTRTNFHSGGWTPQNLLLSWFCWVLTQEEMSNQTETSQRPKILWPNESCSDGGRSFERTASKLPECLQSLLSIGTRLDEATCAFHGVCRFRAFNPNKPDKFHLKLYAVSEADSGYCLGLEVSTGKEWRNQETKNIEWPSTLSLIQKQYDVVDNSMLKFGECPVMPGTTVNGIIGTVMQICTNIACWIRDAIYTLKLLLQSPPGNSSPAKGNRILWHCQILQERLAHRAE